MAAQLGIPVSQFLGTAPPNYTYGNTGLGYNLYTPAGAVSGTASAPLSAPGPSPNVEQVTVTAPAPASGANMSEGTNYTAPYDTAAIGGSPYQIAAPDISPNITPASVGDTAPNLTAGPSPGVEQVNITAAPSPQQVASPNFTPFQLTAGQLAGLTPSLTPYGGMAGSPFAGPSPGAAAGPRKQPSSGGGGSSGGGAPSPPQRPQSQQRPQPIYIRNVFSPGTGTRARAGGGAAMVGHTPGGSPAAGYSPAYSPAGGGGFSSLFGGSNIWLPILFGGLLLYAATEAK